MSARMVGEPRVELSRAALHLALARSFELPEAERGFLRRSGFRQVPSGCVQAAEVVAVDASRGRVEEMKELLSKLGVRNVHIVVADSASLKLAWKFERVLLDAPCTNSGAIASDPALRLALWEEPDVDRYTKLQTSLLKNSLQHLESGGLLVYSTCSLLSEEGEKVVDAALQPERLDPSGMIGENGYTGFSCSSRVRRLFPHLHRTTGFFLARYKNV